MPTRESILALVRSGLSYRQISRKLGLKPGAAYLIATGSAADGGDETGPGAERREGEFSGSAQHLANPPLFVPQTDEAVGAWIRGRVAADPALRTAWAARSVAPPPLAEDGDDLIDVIGHDHGQIRYLQQQLQTLPGPKAQPCPTICAAAPRRSRCCGR